ncbi:hamartin-like, partial [Tropilaelaps mercedesae]
KDKDLIQQLVLLYLQSRSLRVLILLTGLRDPHHKWFFERCSEHLRSGDASVRTSALKMLLCVVQGDPPWLHDIHQKIVREMLHVVKESKESGEVTNCFIAIVIMASLLPLVPGAFDKRGLDNMFQAFSMAADMCVRKKQTMAELNRQHLCSGLFTFYKVLYSMFPCNFLAFLRTTYGSSNSTQNKPAWIEIVWPMMKRTYFHPFLVQYNVDSETHKDRWKGQQKHDIIGDCQNYFVEQQQQQQQQLRAFQEHQRDQSVIGSCRPKLPASKPCSIPKRAKDFVRDLPASDGVLGKTPHLLDVMSAHPPSDVSSSLGSVDIAEEAIAEDPPLKEIGEIAVGTSGGCTPQKGTPQKRRRRSSSNLPSIPSEGLEDDGKPQSGGGAGGGAFGTDSGLVEEDRSGDKGFCSTTQRLTQEPTNSISEHAENQDDPPAHSEMESLLARQRYLSQCQASPPGVGSGSPQGLGLTGRLTRSMSCPSTPQLSQQADDSGSLSEATSSSNEDLSSKCLSLSLWPHSPEPRKNKDPDALDEKSPAEILEEHMRACAAQVMREVELQQQQQQQQQQSGSASQCGPQGGSAGAMLRSYEREQSGAKDHQPTIVELQKSGQVRDIHEELKLKTLKISELQRSLDERDSAMEVEVRSLLERARKQEDEIKRIMVENHEIAISNTFNKNQLDDANTRVNHLGAKLHETQLNLESLRIKAEELAVYRDKCARLEQELIVLQEMYRRLEEINRRGTHDASQVHSRDELAKELKNCRSRMDYRKHEADAANERHKAMSARAEEAEKALDQARKMLLRTEMNAAEQIRAKDERIAALRKSHESLTSAVLRLHGQVDEHNAIKREHEFQQQLRKQGPDDASEGAVKEQLQVCAPEQQQGPAPGVRQQHKPLRNDEVTTIRNGRGNDDENSQGDRWS